MAATKRARKNNNRAGKICIGMILVAFVITMSVQIVKANQKRQELVERQMELEAQYEEETERKQELEEYEAYTQTNEFIEDEAKSKLGMAYEDEIIFKED